MKEKVPHRVVQGVCIKVSYSITRHLGRPGDVRDRQSYSRGRTGERETGEGEVMGAIFRRSGLQVHEPRHGKKRALIYLFLFYPVLTVVRV